MLSFSTEFPVHENSSVEQFLICIRTWLIGSPHSKFQFADLAPLGEQAQWDVAIDNEQLDYLDARRTDDLSVAIRYLRLEKALEWTTTLVYSETADSKWVSVRVNNDATTTASRLPAAKKPLIVESLLGSMKGGLDGEIRVQEAPIFLSNSDIDFAARCIQGTAKCRLPIVYLSAPFKGGRELDHFALAGALAGMAHVLVEPNRAFSVRLMHEVSGRNVYGGSIGVYWPEAAGRKRFAFEPTSESMSDTAKLITEEVRIALCNRRPLSRCTRAFVEQAYSRLVFEQLKQEGSHELDKYVAAFDADIRSKSEQLEDAEREIRRLQAELKRFEGRQVGGGEIALRGGGEQNLYPGELTAIVRDAIEDASNRALNDSRRAHVLTALLKANPVPAEREQLRSDLKELLRGYRSMTPKIRTKLESMGFELTDEGKHFKARFMQDDRYVFALPKSGSDQRGGLNLASDLIRLIF